MDTRTSQSPLGQSGLRRLSVLGAGGLPSSGVRAVVMNVTVTDTTAASYLTVYPDGVQRPTASNLNWRAGETRPNLVEVAVGVDGMVDFYNAAGSTDVIADIEGWVGAPAPDDSGLFSPVPPKRVLDTRDGTGGNQGAMPPKGVITVAAGPMNASAVVLNVTVTNPSAAGYLTIWPHGAAMPAVSNLNFVAGQTVANRVQVKTDAAGMVDVYNAAGSVDVIMDLNGVFGAAPGATARFTGTTPTRLLDTRAAGPSLAARQTRVVPITGHAGVPMNATAVVVNVTATDTTAASYLTLSPDLVARPTVSDLNWTSGLTIANLAVVKLGSDGAIDLYNAAGSADVVLDVVGWYS